MILNYSTYDLEQLGAIHTATEIEQQPDIWKKVITILKGKQQEIEDFMQNLSEKSSEVRVILTGAGTSAYVGETVLSYLKENNQYQNFSFESIATTDIVSAPYYYLKKEIPTLLVSFARSGNSPESLAATKLGEQLVDQFYQLIITCNEEGQLALNTKLSSRSLLLLMPPETNDKGFAMTSSFTSMLLSASVVFQTQNISKLQSEMSIIAEKGQRFLSEHHETVNKIASLDFNRIVYLGSAVFNGLARESALKMLELSGGEMVAVYESPLGFRHGPKSLINDETVVVHYISNDPYTRKYDIDMLKEIKLSELNVKVVCLAQNPTDEIRKHSDYLLAISSETKINDMQLSFLFILFAQTLSLKKSIQLGIRPDNPSPEGIVNRVVQGVTIYPFE